jgi:radical SAM superfamily enzyme
MAREYLAGEFVLPTLEEYVSTVCDQIELLSPETVIGRVTGDGAPDSLIAPEWSRKKFVVMNEIDKELARRDTVQGAKKW